MNDPDDTPTDGGAITLVVCECGFHLGDLRSRKPMEHKPIGDGRTSPYKFDYDS